MQSLACESAIEPLAASRLPSASDKLTGVIMPCVCVLLWLLIVPTYSAYEVIVACELQDVTEIDLTSDFAAGVAQCFFEREVSSKEF
jgi:hypothetical protein